MTLVGTGPFVVETYSWWKVDPSVEGESEETGFVGLV